MAEDEHDKLAALQAAIASLTMRVQSLESAGSSAATQFGISSGQRPAGARQRPGSGQGTSFATDRPPIPTAAALLQRAPIPSSLESLEIPMAATRIVVTQMVSSADSTGAYNVCIGGAVLSWIDVAAGLAAKTLARGPCVTASVDAVHFLRTCRVGAVVVVAAMVNRTFKSSMEVGARVEEEDPATGQRRHCVSAYLTFVMVQPGGGGGRALPRVLPTTARHRGIFVDAQRRREQRLAARERARRDPELAQQEAACRLLPVTHRVRTPTLPPALRRGEGGLTRGGSAGSGLGETSEVGRPCVGPSMTTAHLTHIIMPQHANSIGITFGGQVMRWMEQAAFIVASRVCRGCGHLLTAGLDGVTFLSPTRVGDTMYVEAVVTAAFGSSLEVMISVWGEAPEVGVPFHCGDAYATMVSVNGAGGPVGIPFSIVPETREEEIRWRGAVARRAARLEVREALRKEKSARPSLDGSGCNGREEEGGGWMQGGHSQEFDQGGEDQVTDQLVQCLIEP